MTQWVEGTLFDNIDKFASSLGFENAGVVLPLATIPWQSLEDRNAFIGMLTNNTPQGGNTVSISKGGKK
jgi:hypothetical protein